MSIRNKVHKLGSEIWHALPKGHEIKYSQIEKHVRKEIMMDRLNAYQYYKNLYDSTKPIRGRVEECRPIGNRRRDWEQITHKVEDGKDVYCAKLYNTEVVQYYSDGAIKLLPESWSTPLTADFMHSHSPFYVYKRYNKLWVRIQGDKDDKHFPLNEEGLMLLPTGGDVEGGYMYLPSEPVVIKQQVVDRRKAKDARKPVQPFLEWAKMFMRLSDGWIMGETKMQVGKPIAKWWSVNFDYGLPEIKLSDYGNSFNGEKMIELLGNANEEVWLKCLCIITESLQPVERVVHKTVPNDDADVKRDVALHNQRYDYDQVKRKVYSLVTDIYKHVEVEVGDKAITKVV